MKRSVFGILIGLLFLATVLGETALANSQKPNILLVVTDDQRSDEMRFLPKTKKLLGKNVLDLQRFYAPFPLCCPARMSIYTGQSAHNHGVDGNFPPEAYYGLTRKELKNTLPTWLQRAGYRTAHVGKFLNGYGVLRPREIPPGWNSWHGTIDQTSYDYYNFWINDNGRIAKYGSDDWNNRVMELSRRIARQEYTNYTQLRLAIFQILMKADIKNQDFGASDGRYITEELGKRVRGVIKNSSRKPFFIEFAPTAPHREDLPENAGYRGDNPRFPFRYQKSVADASWKNSPSYNESDTSDKPSLLREIPPLEEQAMPLSGEGMEEMMTFYRRGRAGSLLALDDELAKTINLLKRSGKWENTVFILTSDNGWLLGEHRIPGDKYLPFEESARVPFLMRGPGIASGRKKHLTQNIDITKTILSLAGARAGRKQEGLDLAALSAKKKRKGLLLEATRPLFVLPDFPLAWDVPYFGIRTEHFKYIRWSYQEEELYNLSKDPYEMRNLALLPNYQKVKKKLSRLAQKLRFCKGQGCLF